MYILLIHCIFVNVSTIKFLSNDIFKNNNLFFEIIQLKMDVHTVVNTLILNCKNNYK